MDLRRSPVIRAWRRWRRPCDLPVPAHPVDTEEANRRFLMYGVLPLWCGPAMADWIMHRRSRIEETTGARESALHALMMTEAGIPVAMQILNRHPLPARTRSQSRNLIAILAPRFHILQLSGTFSFFSVERRLAGE